MFVPKKLYKLLTSFPYAGQRPDVTFLEQMYGIDKDGLKKASHKFNKSLVFAKSLASNSFCSAKIRRRVDFSLLLF